MSVASWIRQLGLGAGHKKHPLRPSEWDGSDLAEYDDTSGTTVANGRLTFEAMPVDNNGESLDIVPKEGMIIAIQIVNTATNATLTLLKSKGHFTYVSADGIQLARIDIKDGKAPADTDVLLLWC